MITAAAIDSRRADLAVAHRSVNRQRDEPTRHKDPDHKVAEQVEMAGRKVGGVPYSSDKTEPFHNQPQRLDRADPDGDRGGDARYRQIVIELANRVSERPAIGADHQHA